METHEFTLIVARSDGADVDLGEVTDALCEVGCDDATLGVHCGISSLDFAREAESFRDAVASAIADIARSGAGLVVIRVEPDDLVTVAEIARRLGQTRESIRLYSTGTRGPGGFPALFMSLRLASPIYRWGDVAGWAREKLGCKEESLPDPEVSRTIGAINAAIELRRYAPGPQEAEAVLEAVKG